LKNDAKIAYCTNVHAGPDLASVQANLSTYGLAVRNSLVNSGDWRVDEFLGIGLWLAESAARETLLGNNLAKLADWFGEHRLLPFTMNGFPQTNFHQAVVKHRVYEPMWWQPERLAYTRCLIQILDGLLPPDQIGSISTLPIAWSSPTPSHDQLLQAAQHLKQLAIELDRLLQSTRREIVIAIEPEPGCAITDGRSMRSFFERYLLDDGSCDIVARHITVCHDICHAAVMRENQRDELAAYRTCGIRIGKIQVSSAIEVDWSRIPRTERAKAFEQLSAFAEDRYLHQTTVTTIANGPIALHEDLPELIRSVPAPEFLEGSWRIHFHVPIFLTDAGMLQTTQADIPACLAFLDDAQPKASDSPLDSNFTGHLEVETYAWSVLPETHRGMSLAEDIASELRYLRALVQKKVFPQPDKSLHLRGEEDR
jgi:hypothetical protein